MNAPDGQQFGNEPSYASSNFIGGHTIGLSANPSLSDNANPVVINGLMSPANSTIRALSALGTLEKLCVESNWTWIDGIILGGCLSYGIGDLNQSLDWFRRVLDIDNG